LYKLKLFQGHRNKKTTTRIAQGNSCRNYIGKIERYNSMKDIDSDILQAGICDLAIKCVQKYK
jgi:hypothetical protein